MCKVVVGGKNISLYINGKINNKVEWEDIQKYEEAKSYYKLTTGENNEGVLLDKQCFTQGDVEVFKQWMIEQHPEIEYGWIHPMYDK